MSLISWLFPSTVRKKVAKPQLPDSSGLSRMDPTRPVGRPGAKEKDHHPVSNGQPANRKNERMARRELLYSVVRDAMMRAGVLSASYKFKVLSLDPRGRQFLVMVDLARDFGGETTRLAEIEAMIAQGAKSRHDILVTAVYWRINEHVAVGDPQAAPARRSTASRPMPLESQPAPLEASPTAYVQTVAQQAQQVAQPQPIAAERSPARYEPLLADEVAAFKHALAAGASPRQAANATSAAAVAQKAAVAGVATSAVLAANGANHGASAKTFDGSAKHGPQSYTLLTGFEDTEMPETTGERAPLLSGTQYGELN